MQKALTLSIVIPAYNEEHHLKACLDSIAEQSKMPLEVIVVDNNSTDNTAKVARSYSFVRVVKESRQGRCYARSCGFDIAEGVIIGRIDADTILPKNWVAYVLNFYHSPEHLTHALTGGCYFYNIRLPHFYGWFQGQIAFRVNRLLLGHYILFGSNMALPKSMWEKVRADTCERNDIHEDLDLGIHTHIAGYKITYREHLRVGIKMRRVRSQRQELWDNLMLWPQTLKVHHKKTWVFGWLGAVWLYSLWPIAPFMEWLARVSGRPGLGE